MATAATSLLDSETFSASSERDALNRVLTAISPDDSEVIYTYDEGGALQAVEVKHRGSSTAETIVGDITYNARGQRESVVYGSTSSPTTTTSYTYDPQTYRLASLSTVRGSDDANLQGLHYHYDPVGNITDIRDTAQQTVYFNNSVVEAANSYTYDATYRLIEATGREHSTQGTTQRTDVQITIGAQPMTSDPSAMRRYTQKFTYDEVGNILKMQHIPASGSGWTRYYEHDADGNRLEKTSAPGDPANGPYTHAYTYDAHGNMTAMPHLSSMVWNHDDELREVTVGTETVYFQYASGMRSRKYVEKSGATTEERIYLGPFEIYRKRISGTLDLERESLHISDDTGRICIIETKTVDSGSAVGSPTGIWRYQLSNHLGSAATEVDGSGAVVSYEEYHPYGTSAYRAVNASIGVSAKRYRYTGMERDEETGLEYHSARYYANWLGRWTATDPIGLAGGNHRYHYADSSPATWGDPNGNAPPSPAPVPVPGITGPTSTTARGSKETRVSPMPVDGIHYFWRRIENPDVTLVEADFAAVTLSADVTGSSTQLNAAMLTYIAPLITRGSHVQFLPLEIALRDAGGNLLSFTPRHETGHGNLTYAIAAQATFRVNVAENSEFVSNQQYNEIYQTERNNVSRTDIVAQQIYDLADRSARGHLDNRQNTSYVQEEAASIAVSDYVLSHTQQLAEDAEVGRALMDELAGEPMSENAILSAVGRVAAFYATPGTDFSTLASKDLVLLVQAEELKRDAGLAHGLLADAQAELDSRVTTRRTPMPEIGALPGPKFAPPGTVGFF